MQTHKSLERAVKVKKSSGVKPVTVQKKVSQKNSNTPPSSDLTETELFHLEMGVFFDLCDAVNTPYSQTMKRLANRRDWLGIAKAKFPDVNSETFPDDYLIQQVLRKNPRLPIKVDREAAAIETFWGTEAQCRTTNDLLRACSGDFATPRRASLAIHPQVLSKLRKIISDILGPLDKKSLEFVEEHRRFGPGATVHCPGLAITATKKLEAIQGFTPSMADFALELMPRGITQCAADLEIVPGSRAATVAKTALTNRFIAIEPSENMRWQLGVGALIRRRLKRTGIDLTHQADRNRLRVRFAGGRYATIDLSSASDTIAKLLIAFLLPPRWAHLLSLFRSPYMHVDGKLHSLEKFSSMGNGFTFELETLIFFSICKLYDEDPYVFGDDMIVAQSSAKKVIDTLELFGFSVNREKTFLDGVFFESCGSDYWRGLNVRPMMLKKEEHEDRTTAVIRMANAIRCYAHRRGHGDHCDRRFLPAWTNILQADTDAGRTAIPCGYGDVGVIKNFDEAAPTKLRYGHEGFTALVYTSRAERSESTFKLSGMYASLQNRLAANPGPEVVNRRCSPSLLAKTFLVKSTWDGTIVAHQFGSSKTKLKTRIATEDELSADPSQGFWGTGGPTASSSYEAIRGRNEKPKFRTMPVKNWHDLGPWL